MTQQSTLSNDELNSIEELAKVRKAVYLMQSIENPTWFRFGGIGVADGQANTPIKRLSQCTNIDNGEVTYQWRYVAMIKYKNEVSGAFIRSKEKILRDYFFTSPGEYRELRIGRKDGFYGVINKTKLTSIFHKAFENS